MRSPYGYTDERGYFTEDTEPHKGSDGWYVVWRFNDEDGMDTDYAEQFDTEEAALKALGKE